MPYYAVNSLDGKTLFAVVNTETPNIIESCDADVCINQIAKVDIVGRFVSVEDQNGHAFLEIEGENHDDAVTWALGHLGHTILFSRVTEG